MKQKQIIAVIAMVVLLGFFIQWLQQSAASGKSTDPTTADGTGFSAVSGRRLSGDGWFHCQFAHDGRSHVGGMRHFFRRGRKFNRLHENI